MASNLPENLVGDMMSNAPRFTLPNFWGTEPSCAPSCGTPPARTCSGRRRRIAPLPRECPQNQTRDGSRCQQGIFGIQKERVTFSTSPLEAEIAREARSRAQAERWPRRDANVSRVVEDALRDRISGGELDLSVLDNPKRSMSATRYSRTALVHYEVLQRIS